MSARLANSALLLGIILMTIFLPARGRDVLIPVAVSVFVWYLLNAIARAHGRLAPGARLRAILGRIQTEIQKFIWIKFVMGLLTGGVTFVVLFTVGVDFATLWSFVVFLLSFIPTVGTLLGILFPSALALLQFDTMTPFLIVIACLGPAQLLLNNWVEPRFMGSSLNLSAFVIFFGLAVSASIWGIIGAILCVPIMAIAAIILSQFPKTRGIAIAMSSDGNIESVAAAPPA